jgi:hypothetical protein
MTKCKACNEDIEGGIMTMSWGYIGPNGPTTIHINEYCPECFYAIHSEIGKKQNEIHYSKVTGVVSPR